MFTEPRFIVAVNGVQRCVAGFDGYAVLSATFSLLRRPQLEHVHSMPVAFHIDGLQGRDHVNWLEEDLIAGDEATLRVSDGLNNAPSYFAV